MKEKEKEEKIKEIRGTGSLDTDNPLVRDMILYMSQKGREEKTKKAYRNRRGQNVV